MNLTRKLSVPRYALIPVSMLVALSLMMASCAGLPTTTEPEALHDYRPGLSEEQIVRAPSPDAEPDQIMREFLKYSSDPSQKYAAARQFLTQDVASAWKPETAGKTGSTMKLLIVDSRPRITVNDKSRLGSSCTVTLTASWVGEITGDSLFRIGDNTKVDVSFSLSKEDGQWRIDQLPDAVYTTFEEFSKNWNQITLYYPDFDGRRLVPDLRWGAFSRSDELSRASAVLDLLVNGPSPLLAPALRGFTVDRSIAFVGADAGNYEFTGLATLSDNDRKLFAASVVWTLARLNIAGPYGLTFDGEFFDLKSAEGGHAQPPADGSLPTLDTVPSVESPVDDSQQLIPEDFANYNPTAESAQSYLHVLLDGKLQTITSDGLQIPEGSEELCPQILSVALGGKDGAAAVCAPSAGVQTLRLGVLPQMGDTTGDSTQSIKTVELDYAQLSAPSMEYSGRTVWIVADPATDHSKVLRISDSSDSLDPAPLTAEVPFDYPQELIPEGQSPDLQPPRLSISTAVVSRSGARVAILVNKTLYVGVVAKDGNGQIRVTNLVNLAPTLKGAVVAVAWAPDGSLVLGTTVASKPVYTLSADGALLTASPKDGLGDEITAVAATSTMIYATTATSLMQRPVSALKKDGWTEVPGLAGLNAVPVIVG